MFIQLKQRVVFVRGHLLQDVRPNSVYEVFNPRSPYRYIIVGGKEIILTKTAIRSYFNVKE